MKNIQTILLHLGLAAFILSLFFVGSVAGDSLWRAGMAILMIDITIIMLFKPRIDTTEQKLK